MPGKINWSNKTFQVPKIEGMRVMRERERIALFLKYVQEYGVSDTYTFPTESLHEKGDLAQVLVCIRGVGIEVGVKKSYINNVKDNLHKCQDGVWRLMFSCIICILEALL